jgi:hypothetical protein
MDELMREPYSHRKHLFVDRDIQGALVRRVLFYWCSCLLFLTIPVVIAKTVVNPDLFFFQHLGEIWRQYWPVYVAAFLMLPFVAYDIVRVSHRFVGPLVRLRGEMKKMADGQITDRLVFRDCDYFQDLATSFCKIVDRIEREQEDNAL